MLRHYSFTLALSAMLMFVVEPIVSKILLPILGGNPAVWNAVVMFFQVLLLLSYGYVHLGRKWLSPKKQALLHLLLLLFSLLFMPLTLSPIMPTGADPIVWLVGVLMMTIGVPFFALAATSPLLSIWLAESKDPAAKNPYRLYAASNIGSMVGLLSYPFLIEPFFSLSVQRIVWSVGYGLLLVMVGFALKRKLDTVDKKTKKNIVQPIPNMRRAEWVLLAFVPSSLMLSVTLHLSVDIAPIPLLWVVPLALYLLSFVLVFAANPIGLEWSQKLFVPILLPLVLMLGLSQALLPYWPWLVGGFLYLVAAILFYPDMKHASVKIVAKPLLCTILFFAPLVIFFSGQVTYLWLCLWYLVGFFLVALVCHGRLSAGKPNPAQLTEFYFFLSLGGALGGIFDVLIAPHLFVGFYELYLVLALAFFLLPGEKQEWKNPRPIALGIVAAIIALVFYCTEYEPLGWMDTSIISPFNEWMWAQRLTWGNIGFASKSDTFAFIEVVVPALAAFYLRKNVPALGVMVTILLMIGVFRPSSARDIHFKDRNFFGMLEAQFIESKMAMYLTNGTTQHGFQYKDKEHATVPTSYYSWNGPLGSVVLAMRMRPEGPGTNVAAVGLGAGTVACLALDGQRTTFFEINPMVDKIAHEPHLFSYLRDCPGSNKVVLGDARLSLQAEPDDVFSLIILDAFNSDAVPIHLLTKEALVLYLQKLAQHGIIAYHISNRHLDLESVIGNLAAAENLAGLIGNFEDSNWIFITRDPADFGALVEDRRFRLLLPDESKRVWTDDYSNVISILKIQR